MLGKFLMFAMSLLYFLILLLPLLLPLLAAFATDLCYIFSLEV